MKLEEINIPVNNKLLSDYWAGNEQLQYFYEYKLTNKAFEDRINYLQSKNYNTEELSNIFRKYMEPFGISEKAEENLQLLANGAYAVVGGQQAGILTGPLYTIYKAITVILLAKQQSEKLQQNIVPIFWIAGEDHDIHEINHTYTIAEGKVKKRIFPTRNAKTMASVTRFDKQKMKDFIKGIFQDYGETNYTSQIYQFILNRIDESDTFTQFFTSLMNEFFHQEGLLFIDSAFVSFRQFESPFFAKLIEHNEEISKAVCNKEVLFQEFGYGTPINAELKNANLFYVKDGERILLEHNHKMFMNEQHHIKFSKEELLQIAKHHPEQLSNNVVTRPLMQEMTIPVLAFVAGPGELAYWGLLKDAFQLLDLQMPIIVPRLNVTIMTKKLEQLMQKHDVTFEQVLDNKIKTVRLEFIKSIQDEVAKGKIEQLYELIEEKYKELTNHLQQGQLEMHKIIEKNLEYHKRQFDYLTKKIEHEILTKNETVLRQLAKIENEIFPNDTFQERIFNPYQFINEYGNHFIHDLLKLPFDISNRHYIVHI